LRGIGWLIVIWSTFMINHFDLFGLRQVYLRMTNTPYTDLPFTQVALYGVVRHPLMLGFLIVFWVTPTMTIGHLLFATLATGYIIVGTWFEERDLITNLGDEYRAYRQRVPMLLPFIRGRRSS